MIVLLGPHPRRWASLARWSGWVCDNTFPLRIWSCWSLVYFQLLRRHSGTIFVFPRTWRILQQIFCWFFRIHNAHELLHKAWAAFREIRNFRLLFKCNQSLNTFALSKLEKTMPGFLVFLGFKCLADCLINSLQARCSCSSSSVEEKIWRPLKRLLVQGIVFIVIIPFTGIARF